jgi:hypothetical protein
MLGNVKYVGRAVVQAVSRWPIDVKAGSRGRVGFVVDNLALGRQGFLRSLQFSPACHHSTIAPHSSITAP